MMRARRRLVAAGAALAGAVLVLGSLLAPGVLAQTATFSAFNAQAVSRGVEVTFGIDPFIISPLGQIAAPFVRTEMNTIPVSDAIASLLWPGDLVHATFGEGGSANSQGAPAYPFTVQATYPDKPSREKVLAGLFPLKMAGLTAEGGQMRSQAELSDNSASATIADVSLQPPGSPRLVAVDAIRTAADAVVQGNRVAQVATARLEGIDLLEGMIHVTSLESVARIVSDGRSVIERQATTTIGRVQVTFGDDVHAAVIDGKGIRIEDPDNPQSLNQALTAVLQYTLSRAGITVAALGSTVTENESAGQAFAGGLLVDFHTGPCEACPALLRAIPREIAGPVADAVAELENQGAPLLCVVRQNINGQLPCLSSGLVPSTGNSFEGTLALGSTAATASAAGAPSFDAGGGAVGGDFGGGFTGAPTTAVFGESFTAPPPAGGAVTPPQIAQPGAPQAPAQLFGLVSEIPSGALVGVGAAFLLLAVGLVVAPSYRP